ncbi:MAG: VapC toxin family domain ribonuclease [Chthoniobacter sp.]|nr:VapC toxin family domain ribonuclease [Chthoniobacter sp.]
MRLYLDAVAIIYAVERMEPWAALVAARIRDAQAAPITSELSCLECKVRPLRLDQHDVVARFDAFFAEGVGELLPVSREVLEQAAALRAKHNFLRTPDAIHLAAAMAAKCDVFLTNDHRLDRFTEIAVEVLAV